MKIFKLYYHKKKIKNICFVLNIDSVEKNINVQRALFFSILKEPGLKNKIFNRH